jgi:hypothetical protein
LCFSLVYNGEPGQKILKNIYLEPEKSDILKNNLHNLQEYKKYLQYLKGLLMTGLDENETFTVSPEAISSIMTKVKMSKDVHL